MQLGISKLELSVYASTLTLSPHSWWMHKWPEPNNGFWSYHKKNYGTNVTYDDFIDMFNPTEFNASTWINFFGDSGAKYFVLGKTS